MKVFKVVVGSYDDKTYYLVRGTQNEDDALAQVKAWYEENYSGGWPDYEPVTVEIIELKKGVIQL